jgi:uncharacterized protein YuzE
MLISYEPNSDVLTITFSAGVAVQSQLQGTVKVNFDAGGTVSSVQIPDASSLLWESGGQVNVVLPEVQQVETVVVTQTVQR